MDQDVFYLSHFGLLSRPFEDVCDPRFIWFGEKHLENLAHLKVGIEERKGILLLVGEEGSGRSVLVERLLRVVQGELAAVILADAGMAPEQFFHFLAGRLGLEPKIASKGDFLFHFREVLRQKYAEGAKVLLVVEHAGLQADEILEQVRLFSNMEENGQKLLSVLLVGDGRLEERLQQQRHRALAQRVAVRREAEALTAKETDAYIRHRLMAAGMFLPVFTEKAVQAIHRLTRGIPRQVNLVCDHALMLGCHERVRLVDEKLIKEYARRVGTDLGAGKGVVFRPRQGGRRASGAASPFRRSLAISLGLVALMLAAAAVALWKSRDTPVAAAPEIPARVVIYFESGASAFPPEAAAGLDRVADYASGNPAARVVIKGYSDARGQAARNLKVSQARADAAKTYLAGKGVPAGRIEARGLGEEKPAAGTRAAADPGLSRRVEIEIKTEAEPYSLTATR